ncbi:MAG: MlaD family protein, partial [Turicibacter sp.]
NYYLVEFHNVTGLQKSSPVLIDGFKVGLVNDIQYDYASKNKVIVEISLDKKLKVQQGSIVELKPGLMGGAELYLKLNTYVSANHAIGDTLKGVYDAGLMGTLENDFIPSFQKILPKIDSIMLGLNQIVNNPALAKSLSHIESTTMTLEQSANNLNNLMSKDIPAIVGNMKNITSDFAEISKDVNSLDLQKTYNEMNESLANLKLFTAELNNPNGTIGLLMRDSSLYRNLNTTVESADKLLIDLKANPKRYVHFSVFGKK